MAFKVLSATVIPGRARSAPSGNASEPYARSNDIAADTRGAGVAQPAGVPTRSPVARILPHSVFVDAAGDIGVGIS